MRCDVTKSQRAGLLAGHFRSNISLGGRSFCWCACWTFYRSRPFTYNRTKAKQTNKKKLSPLMSRICLCCCLSSFLHFSFLINLWVCLNLAISSVKRTWHMFQCNLLRLIDALRYWQFRRWAVQRCDCWADNSLALPVSTSRCFRNITRQSKNPTQDHLFFFFFLTVRHLSAPSVLTPFTNPEPWFPSYGIENWFKVWMWMKKHHTAASNKKKRFQIHQHTANPSSSF